MFTSLGALQEQVVFDKVRHHMPTDYLTVKVSQPLCMKLEDQLCESVINVVQNLCSWKEHHLVEYISL